MKPRILIAVIASLVAAVLLAACGSSDTGTDTGGGDSAEGVETASWGGQFSTEGQPKRGGKLVVDQASPPGGISPLHFLVEPDNAQIQVMMQMFSGLVEFQPGSIDPQPGLAESWDISNDGLTYTFHLRDAEFSNGMPVTAADAKFTLDFARGPESIYAESLFGQITSISDPDPHTLVIKLAKPVPALLDYLGIAGALIVPAKLVEEEGMDTFNQHPVGSGPFMLKRWRPEQSVEMVRNDRYWRKGMPYLDAVDLNATQNDNTRVLNVESGTSDAADFVPFSQISTIDAAGNASVLVAPGADMGVVMVNNAKQPLNETVVRQALNYATPVDSIIKAVFHDYAPRMNTTMPKLKFWTDKAKAYPYDLEKAKELLAESSAANGFTVEIKIDGSDELASQIAQIIEQSWGEIGVKAKIRLEDVGALADDFPSGNYEMIIFRPGSFTSDVPVDDEFASLLFNDEGTHNLYTNYKNEKVAQLVSEAVVEMDEGKRRQLFEEVQIDAMKDPNILPLVYTPNRIAVRDDVKGFNYLLAGFWRLEKVWKE